VPASQSSLDRTAVQNHLLKALPVEVLELLLGRLERTDLNSRVTISSPNLPITAAIFPERGYASMLACLEDGGAVEVGVVGSEGMIGLPLLFDTDHTPIEAIVQTPGTALAMQAPAFKSALEKIPSFRKVILHYAMAFQVQVAMTAACNGRHVVERRLARWLLMAHDRSASDTFAMTHEFLSMMLGVRRAGITVAAGMLQSAGLIKYGGGHVTITNRRGLEAATCECYRTVQHEYTRLIKHRNG
jgi:CRP-like cAMP-binding protein